MKIKTIIPFVVILALLVGMVVWRKATEAPPPPLATQMKLETLAPEGLSKNDVARVEIFTGDDTDARVTLERDGEAWRIATLYNAPVNQATLDAFLDNALALKGEPRATADTDERLAEFSLRDEDAFHVQLFRDGEEAPAMHVLTGKTADFRTVFIRPADANRVFVESINLRRESGASEAAPPRQTHWLQTTLLELDKDKINRVALQYPDKEIVFERVEVIVEQPEETEEDSDAEDSIPPAPETTHEWKLVEGGFTDTFTDQAFQSLLNRLAMLTITDAVDPEREADWGFEAPAYQATISVDGEDDVIVYGGRGEPGGDAYVQLVGAEPPLIYQIGKFNFDQLFPEGSKLFALTEWDMDEDSIQRMEIQRANEHIVLAREEEDWRVEMPALDLDIQKTTLDSMVSAASTLKPADYGDPDHDAGPFGTVITLHTGEDESRVLQLGQVSTHTGGRYVRFNGNDALFVLSRADTEKLTPPTRDLYTLSVIDVDLDDIAHITVAHEDVNLLVERDADDAWQRVVNNERAEALLNDVEDLVYALNAFQVDDFLLEQTHDAVQAVTTITIAKSDETSISLQLSAEADGAHKATVSGLPYVFSVRADELARLMEDMEALTIMPEPDLDTETAEPDAEEATEEEIPEDALVIPMDALESAPTDAPPSDAQVIEIDVEAPDADDAEDAPSVEVLLEN